MSTSHEALLDRAAASIDALLALRRRAICAQPMHRHVSMPQMYILMTLEERGAMTVSELAHLLTVSAPSASSILDRMEENGLVERIRDKVDRRVVHVRIVGHGRRIMEEVGGLKHDQLHKVLDELTDTELLHVAEGAAALERVFSRGLGQGDSVANSA